MTGRQRVPPQGLGLLRAGHYCRELIASSLHRCVHLSLGSIRAQIYPVGSTCSGYVMEMLGKDGCADAVRRRSGRAQSTARPVDFEAEGRRGQCHPSAQGRHRAKSNHLLSQSLKSKPAPPALVHGPLQGRILCTTSPGVTGQMCSFCVSFLHLPAH